MAISIHINDLQGDVRHYFDRDVGIREELLEFGMREVSTVVKEIAREFATEWADAFLADPITQALSDESATTEATEVFGFNRFITSLIGEMTPGMIFRQIQDIAAYIPQSVSVHSYRAKMGQMRAIQVQAVNDERIEILTQFRPGGQPDIATTSWHTAMAGGLLQTESGGKFYLSVTDLSDDREFFKAQGRLTRGIMVRRVPEGVGFWQSPPINLIERSLEFIGGEWEFVRRVNYGLKRRLGRRSF